MYHKGLNNHRMFSEKRSLRTLQKIITYNDFQEFFAENSNIITQSLLVDVNDNFWFLGCK